MWSTDIAEAETLEELAKKLGEYHSDNDLNGDPVVKCLYNDNGDEESDEVRITLQNEAAEWSSHFKAIAEQDRDYTQERINKNTFGGF